jgi:hypothetical protein
MVRFGCLTRPETTWGHELDIPVVDTRLSHGRLVRWNSRCGGICSWLGGDDGVFSLAGQDLISGRSGRDFVRAGSW